MKKIIIAGMIVLWAIVCMADYAFAQTMPRFSDVIELDLDDTVTEDTTTLGSQGSPVKRIQVRNRTAVDLRMAFDEATTTDYFTIKSGTVYDSGPVSYFGVIRLRDVTTANQTAEIIIWR